MVWTAEGKVWVRGMWSVTRMYLWICNLVMYIETSYSNELRAILTKVCNRHFIWIRRYQICKSRGFLQARHVCTLCGNDSRQAWPGQVPASLLRNATAPCHTLALWGQPPMLGAAAGHHKPYLPKSTHTRTPAHQNND